MITIHLRIKFRAMFTTIYTLDKEFKVSVGVPVPHMPEAVLFNDRGVFLSVRS